MDWTHRRERARSLLASPQCIYPANVYDPLSARAAEDLGYEWGMLAGSAAALAVTGAPDLALITLSEFAEQAYRICRAGELPLLVDADHGYGNALSVRRTVEELETAGVAALTIEDTLLPAAYGARKTRLISLEEGVGKMRAALDARQDPRLIIAARTSATAFNGLEDAVARARAYEAAGVDALFLSGDMKTRAQLDAIAEAVKLPLMLGMAAGPELRDRDYLASRHVRFFPQNHTALHPAVRATYAALKAQRELDTGANVAGVAPEEVLKHLSRRQRYDQWKRDYLGN